MTELYEERIDAMKARESVSGGAVSWTVEKWQSRVGDRERRNADRLAAYKRKRAALDGMMGAIGAALLTMGHKRDT